MPSYIFAQLPQIENLSFTSGDDLSIGIRLNQDITGNTFTANIIDSTGTQTPFNITISNYLNGYLSISLSNIQTAGLFGAYNWYMQMVTGSSVKRTIINGDVNVFDPSEPALIGFSNGSTINVGITQTGLPGANGNPLSVKTNITPIGTDTWTSPTDVGSFNPPAGGTFGLVAIYAISLGVAVTVPEQFTFDIRTGDNGSGTLIQSVTLGGTEGVGTFIQVPLTLLGTLTNASVLYINQTSQVGLVSGQASFELVFSFLYT